MSAPEKINAETRLWESYLTVHDIGEFTTGDELELMIADLDDAVMVVCEDYGIIKRRVNE